MRYRWDKVSEWECFCFVSLSPRVMKTCVAFIACCSLHLRLFCLICFAVFVVRSTHSHSTHIIVHTSLLLPNLHHLTRHTRVTRATSGSSPVRSSSPSASFTTGIDSSRYVVVFRHSVCLCVLFHLSLSRRRPGVVTGARPWTRSLSSYFICHVSLSSDCIVNFPD
jgi:hypothetical protein